MNTWPYSFIHFKLFIIGWMNIIAATLLTFSAVIMKTDSKFINFIIGPLKLLLVPTIYKLFLVGVLFLGFAKIIELLHIMEINSRNLDYVENIADDIEQIHLTQRIKSEIMKSKNEST